MDQRNLILAIVLSVTILLTFQIFFAPPPRDPGTQATTATGETLPGGGDAEVPQLSGGGAAKGAGEEHFVVAGNCDLAGREVTAVDLLFGGMLEC